MTLDTKTVYGLASSGRRIFRARWVFPVASPPIAGGLVEIDQGWIKSVGQASAGGDVEDLGNVALLPGLVNAHAHLEFSDLTRPLGEPGMEFTQWLRLVIDYRRQNHIEPIDAVAAGLLECERHGTQGLGEIAQPDWSAAPYAAARLAATVYLELIAPTAERVCDAVCLAERHLRQATDAATWQAGLSPHSPYSVHPELLGQIVSLSAQYNVPLAMHLAESTAELELIRHGSGPLQTFLRELGTWRPDAFRDSSRPLDYLRTLATAFRAAVIHGNYLDDEEIAFLGAHADSMAVVYCPRTHEFFRHAPYPLEKMLKANAVVALGTDSRASSPDLNLLAEMRRAAQRHPKVKPEVFLRIGTVNGAFAIGLDRELGTIEPGKRAALTIVELPDRDVADPHELLLLDLFKSIP
jgi:aminodeoxyfutalosine deaminase